MAIARQLVNQPPNITSKGDINAITAAITSPAVAPLDKEALLMVVLIAYGQVLQIVRVRDTYIVGAELTVEDADTLALEGP